MLKLVIYFKGLRIYNINVQSLIFLGGIILERRKDNRGRVLNQGESQRKDGRYQYRFTDDSGKRRTIYALTLNELRIKEKEIGLAIDNGIDVFGARQKTLNDMFDVLISIKKASLKPSTLSTYSNVWNRHIRNTLGCRSIDRIRKSELQMFYANLSNTLSESRINIAHILIHGCLDLSVDDGLIMRNPADKAFRLRRQNKPIVFLDEKQFNYLASKEKNSTLKNMMVLSYETGMRFGEICALSWNDVDLFDSLIHVQHSASYVFDPDINRCRWFISVPKTSTSIRTIPLTAKAKKALIEERKSQFERGRNSVVIDGVGDFVFTTKDGKLISLQKMLRHLKHAARDNSLDIPENVTFHVFRKSFASRAVRSGMNPKTVQKILGHSNIDLTMRVYANTHIQDDITEMKRMELLGS